LFYENGTQYNQTLILNSNYEVDPTLLAEQGLPYYASSWVVYLLTSNMASSSNVNETPGVDRFDSQALGATVTHLLLWNWNDLRSAWSWVSLSSIRLWWADFNWKVWQADGMRRQDIEDDQIDPHYKQMLKVSCTVLVVSVLRYECLRAASTPTLPTAGISSFS